MAEDLRTGGTATYPVLYKDAKMHLMGLGEWSAAAEAEGYNENYINTEVVPAVFSAIELELNTMIRARRIVSTATPDTDPYVADSPYDYIKIPPNQLVKAHGFTYFGIYVPHAPILEVHRFRIIANAQVPVMTIPSEWIETEPEAGLIYLQPATVAANAGALVTGQMVLSLTTLGRDYLPHGIEVIYDAGLPDGWENGAKWASLKRYVSKKIALEILHDLTEVFDPGRQSVSGSAMGVNTTINYERFVRRRGELEEQCDKFASDFIQQTQGIRVGGIY